MAKTVVTVPYSFGNAISAARLFTNGLDYPFGNIWVAIKEGKAWAIGMDAEAIMMASVSAQVKGENNTQLLLDANLLAEAWRSFPRSNNIDFTLEPEKQKAEFTPLGTRFRMNGEAGEHTFVAPDYVKALIKAEKTIVEVAELRRLIRTTVDVAGGMLNTVLLKTEEGRLQAVASDGYRLAIATCDAKTSEVWSFLSPPSAMKKMLKLLGKEGNVSLAADNGHLLIQAEDFILVVNSIAIQYPDYQSIIPQTHNIRLTVLSDEIKQTLKQVAVVARRGNSLVRMDVLPGRLAFTAHSENGQVQATALGPHIEGNVNDLAVGFNVGYMQDAISFVDAPSVVISITSPQAPLLVQGVGDEDFLYVLMPMHLEDVPEDAVAEVEVKAEEPSTV